MFSWAELNGHSSRASGGSPPFTAVHDQGKLFEGECVVALSFQVRQCTIGQVGP